MTTAHTIMLETHRYIMKALDGLTIEKGTVWIVDARSILTKLARSIETFTIWGCHE